MKAQQAMLDFTDIADMVILVAVDGREVEVPRRDLIVPAGPRARGRYLLPESVLQAAPRGQQPPPRRHPPVAASARRRNS